MSLSEKEIKDLENRIGYCFRSRSLLLEALTHSSFTDSSGGSYCDYERLEFLGDLVLGLCVGELLYTTFPKEREGDLSLRMHSLVSGRMCSQIAMELGLANFIRTGSELDSSNSQKMQGILADIFESVLAAIYLDSGMDSAKSFVAQMYRERIHTHDIVRHGKMALQEWAHKQGLSAPQYIVRTREGPDHDPLFIVEVELDSCHQASGQGRSKRAAETEAACNLLLSVGVWKRDDDGIITKSTI